MQKEYYIYKHTCKDNNKVYIGQSCQNPSRRWRDGEGYKGSTYFYNAIQKYSWDNFTHEIIECNLTKEEANIREEYWIAFYQSNIPSFGYNLKSGGDNNSYTDESKDKMSRSAIERFSKEEERVKQSERIKQAYQQDPSRWDSVKKPIQCVETGEIFNSTTEAAEWCGIISLSSFGNYFAGRSKTCGRHPETKERLHWVRGDEIIYE